MRRVIVLGSTGSIGKQALQVVAGGCELTVVGLSCHRNVDLLLEQALALGVQDLAVGDSQAAASVPVRLFPELQVRGGGSAAAQLVREVEADIVLNAIVGFAGLEATLAALECGRTVALANKESLVCAGSLVLATAKRHGGRLLPVDSEHSALFQLLATTDSEAVASLTLTASGGPFRGRSRSQLAAITVEEALAHPTWDMGQKITIDSATLMNKGFEIIEAHHLFGFPYESIDVVVHPQSVVHSLVRLVDNSMLAHLGVADMRIPLAFALYYPQRVHVNAETLDLAALSRLDFFSPDEDTFPALRIARQAGKEGDRATCALNAANEVAVEAFLQNSLPFLAIYQVVEKVVAVSGSGDFGTYQEVVDVDREARAQARELLAAVGW